MKYNKGDVLEYKSHSNQRTWQVVLLISTVNGGLYKLRVLTSSKPEEVGQEQDINTHIIDNNTHTFLVSRSGGPAAEKAVGIGHIFAKPTNAYGIAVKAAITKRLCNCETFQIVHFGCKCGGA